MTHVRLESVTKQYGKTLAVDRVSLAIEPHEFLVLLGPSGCGKSTTLRMVAGLEEVSAGTITIGSRVVNDVAPKDRDVAMVFQNYALYPHMSVFQNMAFGLKMRRVPRAEIEQRVRAAAKTLGIEPLLDRKPWQLSGGERQRVAVGRAIVRDPAVFLFDEPLSNLDAKLRVVMRSELVRLQDQLRTTTIYVTHDQIDAMMMGHRIVIMRGGRIEQVGPPLDVYRQPATRFVAEFIGSPPMNFVRARVLAEPTGIALTSSAGNLTLGQAESARVRELGLAEVDWGIRPEDIQLGAGEVAADGVALLPARVTAVHVLGHETVVESEAGTPPVRFMMRVTGQAPARGTTLPLGIPLHRVHLFDPTSGRALRG